MRTSETRENNTLILTHSSGTMDVATVFSERSESDLEPDLNADALYLSTMNNEETSEFSVENKMTEGSIEEQQCLETEQSVQALLDQEKGTITSLNTVDTLS